VIALTPELDRIRAALLPLDGEVAQPCWNLDELAGWLPPFPPVGAAVLVGLVPRSEGLRVLLTRRTSGLRHHAGQVSFPGGRIESDDIDACAAALRETQEEIGVPPSLVRPLGFLDPLATITGFRILPLVAAISPDHILRPDPGEVDEVFEVPLDYLMAPANLERIALDVGGRSRSVLQFAQEGTRGQRIWGASASILFNLRQRLEGMT
jgi:8-oxo-dGTP pyrophosphatase MutT (NUDIX family)